MSDLRKWLLNKNISQRCAEHIQSLFWKPKRAVPQLTQWSFEWRNTTPFCPLVRTPVQASPTFPKFTICYFTFTKDLHQYLFPLAKRNLKRTLTFQEGGKKQKWHSVSVLQRADIEAACTPSRKGGTTKLLPWSLGKDLSISASQH